MCLRLFEFALKSMQFRKRLRPIKPGPSKLDLRLYEHTKAKADESWSRYKTAFAQKAAFQYI